MNQVFLYAAHNAVFALLLALVVTGITRGWRNPPVAHLLWLMVLVRLVAPSVLSLDWAPAGWADRLAELTSDRAPLAPQSAVETAHSDARHAVTPTPQRSAASVPQSDSGHGLSQIWTWLGPALFWLWLGGALLGASVTVTRIVRFEWLLRHTLPAPVRLRRLVSEVSARLGVRRVPDVRLVDSVDVPFLWCGCGHPTVVLPTHLCQQFEDRQVSMILAHELAHLRRRDHWVRAIELLVTAVYWWNPLAWAVRRRVHQTEDLCCDAWVRATFPNETRCYGEILFKLAESLPAPRGARLLPASPLLHAPSLKERIEMMLESRYAPNVSGRALIAITLLAVLVLPASVQSRGTQVRAGSGDAASTAAAQKPDSPTTSAFPYVVKFEQGATQFLDGDQITIVEVRGTADTFVPGNIYWIRGTYTLGSHDRASIAAYTTAMDAANGTTTPFKPQSMVVEKGAGTFTLFLPMSYRGSPHVSFYPADGGESFGGNYFGTGDSVLKKWWGTKETE